MFYLVLDAVLLSFETLFEPNSKIPNIIGNENLIKGAVLYIYISKQNKKKMKG